MSGDGGRRGGMVDRRKAGRTGGWLGEVESERYKRVGGGGSGCIKEVGSSVGSTKNVWEKCR